mmetsp:Transcript_39196/g.63167  ORF Transcript_39196/g.63167 Transcript_39196/m.63167 type:complete len:92 (-) Transcript_39196:268-543(-)
MYMYIHIHALYIYRACVWYANTDDRKPKDKCRKFQVENLQASNSMLILIDQKKKKMCEESCISQKCDTTNGKTSQKKQKNLRGIKTKNKFV